MVRHAGHAGLVGLGLGLGLACMRASPEPPREQPIDPRVDVRSDAYGATPSQPDALGLGERLELDALGREASEAGGVSLVELRGAGPLVIAWLGGAEHAELIAWLRSLVAGLPELDARAASLVVVRPLPRERSEAFAAELGLQAVVVSDESGELARAAGWSATPPTWGLLIVAPDATLVYRKLGGRPPELDELLAVLDDRPLRCCIDTCAPPCSP